MNLTVFEERRAAYGYGKVNTPVAVGNPARVLRAIGPGDR